MKSSKYDIYHINKKERWIYIYDECSPYNESDDFVELISKINKHLNGKIYSVGWQRYKIDNDPFELIYQWDDLFGIVVIYKRNSELNEVVEFLSQFGVRRIIK